MSLSRLLVSRGLPSESAVTAAVLQAKRGSSLPRHAATRNVQTPSRTPSASQNGSPSPQVTALPATPSLLRLRFGSTCHSKAQPAALFGFTVQSPGVASVQSGGGGAQCAAATQEPPRFDHSEFTVCVSPSSGSCTSQKFVQMSADSSPPWSSNQPASPTGGPSGSSAASDTS